MKCTLVKTVDSWAVIIEFSDGEKMVEHFPTRGAAYAWASRAGVELIDEN